MTGHDRDLQKELDATLQTRKELGSEYEAELVDAFLEKVERKVDAAVEQRMRRLAAEQQMSTARGGPAAGRSGEFGSFGERFGFAIVSLVLAIPLTAIAVAQAGMFGLVVAWAGIVAVNVAQVTRGFPWQREERG
ncbi:hypothetical protein I5Q34_14405 [Streptomyces sp. AV19]|uniref:hypothetical protein n=1 Tax=Streptomyces sp. AV19 TaxID=2793068 RepID=UPI0018FE9061|nr:hypothetical protein [Streptomyces sp. AV19]MBH1935450.1 hypothetical protein [Streptomyces sp. AV19]MDG4531336.1 hypothetical protein [Streptomyces sp. AV19]